MQSLVKSLLGKRSVAAWQVVGGVCAAVTLVAGCCTWAVGTLASRDPSDASTGAPSASGSARARASASPAVIPLASSGLLPFTASETRYLATMKPLNETYGWDDVPRTVNNVTYRRAMTATGCVGDEYRTYLVKKEYRRFRAEAGIADDSRSSYETEVYLSDENGTILYRDVARPGEPAAT
ncbi:hypothetical protein [Catellatospora tritici]|uniref:hypothetical protein n=1 Tax=Catellatospora tritici TaxID=2851566 RepID=UPI001C2CFE3C|nr:hypothetical protein [Catellatospora tritici]MBV1854337.1 hypothetical protein [Catellatospora tritici]